MTEKNYITPGGYKKLVDELTELATVERPRVVREVSDAAAEGDRSENAAYIYGKRRLREIDRRMGFLQRRLEHVQVIKLDEQRKDRVFFGAWVEVEDEEGETHVYQIVGVDEVEADKGRISWKSPVGRALIGKRVDESVTVRWHAGERELTVTSIAYEPPPGAENRKPASKRIVGDAAAGDEAEDEPEDDDEDGDDDGDDDERDVDDDDDDVAPAPADAAKPKNVTAKAPPAKSVTGKAPPATSGTAKTARAHGVTANAAQGKSAQAPAKAKTPAKAPARPRSKK